MDNTLLHIRTTIMTTKITIVKKTICKYGYVELLHSLKMIMLYCIQGLHLWPLKSPYGQEKI